MKPKILEFYTLSVSHYIAKSVPPGGYLISTLNLLEKQSHSVTRDELGNIPIANDQYNTLENTLVIIFIE